MQTSASPSRPSRVLRWALLALAFALEPALRPYRWAQRQVLVRRYRKRMTLVDEVARYLRRLEIEERNRNDRLHIVLRPETWPGTEKVCDPADGGCGTRQRFGPLRMARVGDREIWKLICPNPRCRKQRVMLATTPGTRKLQAAALEEFERKGDVGEAYGRFAAAVAGHNRRMAEVRRVAAKKGAGEAPEAVVARLGGETPAT